jgi:hypothetical protein
MIINCEDAILDSAKNGNLAFGRVDATCAVAGNV